MQDAKEIWNIALKTLEKEVTAVSFDLWIKSLEPIDLKNNVLYLSTTSETAKNRVLKLHEQSIRYAIKSANEDIVDFKILDPDETTKYKSSEQESKVVSSSPICKFNEKFTFDNFVVGNSNKYVYAAARGVAENPVTKINPLYIYGGVGLGKTHLLHAIGNYLSKTRPDLKVMYVTCNKFTNDYIDCMANKDKIGAIASFRNKYTNVDVLMVDDIQFISKKTSTQEEFFNVFNELYQNNKQIIIASDRAPKEIETLEDRLRSRFSMGLIQDIQFPDYETRFAILQKKAQQEHYNIDEDVIDYIATNSNSNIREMEGVLCKVVFYANLSGKTHATMDDVAEALKDQVISEKKSITSDKIIVAVCKYFNISKDDLIGKKKNKEIVEPRQIAMYLICDMMDLPLTSIGDIFGGRDHTTVIHAREKILNAIKDSNRMRVTIDDIKNTIEHAQ